jgi:hypothetical protein
VIGNVAVRLGEGFDLVCQTQYEKREGDIASHLGREDLGFQVGFVYGFERVFNSQFGDREFLLNLEYQYTP